MDMNGRRFKGRKEKVCTNILVHFLFFHDVFHSKTFIVSIEGKTYITIVLNSDLLNNFINIVRRNISFKMGQGS